MVQGGSSPRARAVIFDMDGLLLDSERLVRACMQRAARELGCTVTDEFFATLIGHSRVESNRMCLEHFGAGLPMAELDSRWRSYFWEAVDRGELGTRPGAGEVLARLNSRRIPCAVATSTRLSSTLKCLEMAQVRGCFAAVAAGDEVSRAKPDPDVYLLAAERLGVEPARCLALEDTDPGALAARRAGMRVIVVPDLSVPSEETKRLAYAVLESLNDLPARLPELLEAV